MTNVLITGITGMDGSILADQLLLQGYKVYGLIRRCASSNNGRIQHLLDHPHLTLIDGDITSQESIFRAIELAEPKFIYNLAAQSFVPYSWAAPVNTFEITCLGAINVLEAIRNTDRSIRFYQASSSEMFGKVQETPQRETTPFYPRSPYGVAKAAAHYATINYRESFGIHASSGILFNHEHERRGEQFVSRKITQGVAKILLNKKKGLSYEPLKLGNLDARRDWGYAEDYVKAMRAIIEFNSPETFVIATGITRTVRDLCTTAVAVGQKILGLDQVPITWKGKEENEVGFIDETPIFTVSKELYRPAEVDLLLGDPSKANKQLNWSPETPFEEMIYRMVKFDCELLCKKLPEEVLTGII